MRRFQVLARARAKRGESRGGGELARADARIEERNDGREEARFLRRGERGGNLRTREAVSWGIPWMKARERARVKVEMEGELKAR